MQHSYQQAHKSVGSHSKYAIKIAAAYEIEVKLALHGNARLNNC